MSKISKIPAGLLGFLGIKNTGKYPPDLGEALLPTWDISRLYLGYDFLYGSVVSTFNAAGYNIIAVAPAGEVWLIHDFSVAVTAGVGEAARVAIARAPPTALFTVNLSPTIDIAASSSNAVTLNRDEPHVLAPGESMGFLAYNVTGILDVYSSYRYTRLQM